MLANPEHGDLRNDGYAHDDDYGGAPPTPRILTPLLSPSWIT